jgi:hypothetical protein
VPRGFEFNGRSYEGLRQTFQKMKSEFLKSTNSHGIATESKVYQDSEDDMEGAGSASKSPDKTKTKTPRKRKAAALKTEKDVNDDETPVTEALDTPVKAQKPRARKTKKATQENAQEDAEEEKMDNGEDSLQI